MTPTQLADPVTSGDPIILSRRDDVDLHLAVELLEHGRPPDVGVRILL